MSYDDYDDSEGEEEVEEVEEEEVESEEEVKPKKRRQKKWKDPSKPKRAMSAFFLYSQAFRPQVKQDNPDASFGDIARTLAAQFKQLSPAEAAKWQAKAEEDKARYQEEMKTYVPMEDPTGGGKGKKKKKDPNAPKRNCSAYFLFSVHARPQVKADNPEASFGDIARLISSRFKQLPDSERAKWDKKAAEDKERYQAEMAEFKGE